MRYVLSALISCVFFFGVSSVSFALDLGSEKEKVQNAETTIKEMTAEGEDKVKEAKEEAKEQSLSEKIQSKSKDDINEKIDDMKSGMMEK